MQSQPNNDVAAYLLRRITPPALTALETRKVQEASTYLLALAQDLPADSGIGQDLASWGQRLSIAAACRS